MIWSIRRLNHQSFGQNIMDKNIWTSQKSSGNSCCLMPLRSVMAQRLHLPVFALLWSVFFPDAISIRPRMSGRIRSWQRWKTLPCRVGQLFVWSPKPRRLSQPQAPPPPWCWRNGPCGPRALLQGRVPWTVCCARPRATAQRRNPHGNGHIRKLRSEFSWRIWTSIRFWLDNYCITFIFG